MFNTSCLPYSLKLPSFNQLIVWIAGRKKIVNHKVEWHETFELQCSIRSDNGRLTDKNLTISVRKVWYTDIHFLLSNIHFLSSNIQSAHTNIHFTYISTSVYLCHIPSFKLLISLDVTSVHILMKVYTLPPTRAITQLPRQWCWGAPPHWNKAGTITRTFHYTHSLETWERCPQALSSPWSGYSLLMFCN